MSNDKVSQKILLDANGNLIDEHGRIIEAPSLKRTPILSVNKKESITRKRKAFKLYDAEDLVKEKRKDMHWDKELERAMNKTTYASRKAFDFTSPVTIESSRKDTKRQRLNFHQKGKFSRAALKDRVREGLRTEMKHATQELNKKMINSALQGPDKPSFSAFLSKQSARPSLSQIYLDTPGEYEFTELQMRLGSMYLDSNFPGFHLNQLLKKEDFDDLMLDTTLQETQEGMDNVMEPFVKDPDHIFDWWDLRLIDRNTKELNEDSICHTIIEHPTPIEPLEKNQDSGPLPLYLTKDERKRLKKQTRKQRQKEIQLKIRVGLMPPPPPKANLKTFMRVHLDSGIQDPTELERKIRAEIAQRIANHESRNQANKLTPEQRREKNAEKARIDREKELIHSIYIVNNLSHPQQLFKIKNQTQKLCLSGCCLQCNEGLLNIIITEGGRKFSDKFTTVMLKKIKWNLSSNNLELTDLPEDEKNVCRLLWKGTNRKQIFKTFFWKKFTILTELHEFLVDQLKMGEYFDLSVQKGFDIPDFA